MENITRTHRVPYTILPLLPTIVEGVTLGVIVWVINGSHRQGETLEWFITLRVDRFTVYTYLFYWKLYIPN